MILANAVAAGSTVPITKWLLVTFFIILIAAALALLVIRMAAVRRRDHIEAISAIVVLWALLAAASISCPLMRQMDWQAKQQQQIESGYFEPGDATDQPPKPFVWWCVICAAYPLMLIWAMAGKEGVDSRSGR